LACISIATLLLSTHASAQDAQSLLVFDASGSMWGQIDGRTKIDIASTGAAVELFM
jgi:Ca-activated chloride channel homolog